MNWNGHFYIDDFWGAFRGASGDNRLHAHAALQLTLSASGNVQIEDAQGHINFGSSILVKSGVPHMLRPIENVLLILVEPESNLAKHLIANAEVEPISRLAESVLSELNLQGPLTDVLGTLDSSISMRTEILDARLLQALEFLKQAPLRCAVQDAARHSGLSESRLRSIAHGQLGVPLSKWLSWQALRRAALALVRGESLAEAAYEAGFADQAHFTRTMVKVFGVTPAEARRLLT